MNGPSDGAPDGSPSQAWELRPSLLAAFDVVAKVFGVLVGFGLPILLPLLFSGHGVSLAALFFGIEALNLYPALIVAFVPAVRLAFTRYTFDEEGVQVETQLLAKSHKRVPWEKVTALRHRRTFLDALLGIERMDIIAYGERGATLHLVGLRGAGPVRDRVAARMRDAATVEALFRSD